MQRKQKLHASLLSRIGVIFLLLIFLSTPLIENFHHHGTSGLSKSISKKHYASFEKKCKLCELIKHQSPHFYISHQQTSIFIIKLVRKQEWYFLLQSSSCFILKCANKGPPVYADLIIS